MPPGSSGSPQIELRGVGKVFGDIVAVDGQGRAFKRYYAVFDLTADGVDERRFLG